MEQQYFNKKISQWFTVITTVFVFSIFTFEGFGQCAVIGPPDTTINCNATTTLTATTSAVTYTLVTAPCPPVPITGTTAFSPNVDDAVTGQIPIGFPFNFYGNIYNTAVISTNGLVGFGAFTFTGFSPFTIPAGGLPNNYIAGMFCDIDIRYGGTITYQTVGVAPNRRFVVSYDNVVPYNAGTAAGTGTASFQIIINETGSFQVIISQLSANWSASNSGVFATSGSENIDGTYAFPVPGRNNQDWPGIPAGSQDCTTFNPIPCVFQRWQQGATVLGTNPNLTVSPTTNQTYTAYWNCNGSICSDDTVVNVIGPNITANNVVQNTNCSTPNGSFSVNLNNFTAGSYTLNYLLNGISQTQAVTVGAPSTTNQGAVFNTGVLATTDLQWNRNFGGTICDGTAGTGNYLDVISFIPSTTGNYTLNMCTPGVDYDGHASLYVGGFNNLNPCGTPGNFIIANDDGNTGGNCENDAQLVATLTAGTTYYLVTTNFGSGLGNYEWTFTGPATATIAAIQTNQIVNFTGLGSGTYTNFSISSGSCGTINLAGPITITSPVSPITTGITICTGGTGTISASPSCGIAGTPRNIGNTFNTGSLANSDPDWIRNSSTTTCDAATGSSENYDVISFTVSATGSYTLNMCTPGGGGANWDGHASLYQNAFNGASPCGVPTNFIIADDDGNATGNCDNDPRIIATLTVGVTYYLVTTSFSAGVTGNYAWTYSNGPAGATLNEGGTGSVQQWYTAATGGTSISSANPFNPVGVAGSGLANSNSAGTTVYYAACSSNPNCRTATNFIISTRPTATISGNGTICAGNTTLSVALTGAAPWSITYTDGTTPVVVNGIITSPYTFIVSPTVATTYTLTAASNSGCASLPAGLTGSGIVTGNKTWTGTTNNIWSVNTNWNNNVLPTASDCVIIPITANNPVVSGTNYNALSGTLTVLNGATLAINATNSITVTNTVTVNAGGVFNVRNNASLVQVNNVTNSGNINVERITNLKLQDYCYWSSPVGNLTAGTFPITSVSPSTPTNLIFKWDTTGVNANGGQGNWINTTENMIPTKGYIARAPAGLGFLIATPTAFTANFVGTPNNGTFTPNIFRGTDFTTVGTQLIPRAATDDNWNLIGNPYPSAIGVKEFINLPANSNIVGGVKIWTHAQEPISSADPFYQNFVTNYFATDYTSINLAGATSGPGDYKIGSGQGFMVLMAAGAPGSSTVTFNNLMRSAAFENNQFYRNSSNTNTNTDNRVWLDLVAQTGQMSRTLVGYIDGATNDEDRLYDMFTDHKPSLNFYSLINGNPMIIQGKANPFDVNDVIPMGIQTPSNGIYTIAISAVDGLFTTGGQTVFLEDKTMNVIHNLTTTPYQFSTNQGIVDDRFVLRYTQNALSSNEFDFSNQVSIFANSNVNIKSATEIIKEVVVYDVLGRTLLDQKNINSKEIILSDLKPTQNVVIVKTTLENNKIIIKKVLF